ncbi:MAG TPA: YwbE family protein [Microscillaceae bacterium]|nr:YwbE family protein [Microscillaceae bacterium]
MNGQNRSNIRVGQKVAVVKKQDQPTGRLTEGVVQRILTKSAQHPHGIKVMLETGEVGRVKEILD